MPSATRHGGAEIALFHLLQERFCAGLDLRVCFLERGELVGSAESLSVRTYVLEAGRLRNPLKFASTVKSLGSIIASEQPDAVLAWMTKGHIYSGVAAAGTKTKALYFQMGLPDGGVVDRLCRIIPATGALGCSEFVAREQRARVRHPVAGVPLAADMPAGVAEISAREMKKRLGFDPSRPLVGIVGRLQRWKGMHIYLRAMTEVARRFPEVQGVVVGGKHDLEPDYPDFLESTLLEEGLEKVVRMVGRQTNVPDWMQAMDVVVHASEREPFGIVVVEAMALRKPVIATKPGGPEEIITHGEDGLLVSHGDSASLAAAICSVLENPGFASKLAEGAKKRSAHFTAAEYAKNVASALDILLGTTKLST